MPSHEIARAGLSHPAGPKQNRGWMSRAAALVLLIPLLAPMVLLSCSGEGGSGGKKSSLPYKELDNAFQPLRMDFESAAGKVRLVAIVSPTCGDCLDAADVIDTRIVPRVSADDLAVFLVWVSVNPPDVGPRVATMAEQYSDAQFTNYFDNTGRLARAIGRGLGLEPGRSAWDVYFIYGREATWDPEGKMAGERKDFDALTAGWTPAPPRYSMGEHEGVTIPAFNAVTLLQLVQKLAAETSGR
jgi:hypothetical protein